WCICPRSAVNKGCPLRNRRTTDSTVSRTGKPNEMTGIATATIVGVLPAPASASALNMKPIKRLPQSPRKIVAGLKLNRRKPRIAPASTRVRDDTRKLPPTRETTNTVRVENKADPAASPSTPSSKLKAFVIQSTHKIVNGRASHPKL